MAPEKLILFDLDDTLSDSKSPMRAGFLAVKASDPAFENFDIAELIEKFKQADIKTWNKHGRERDSAISEFQRAQLMRELEKSKMKRFYRYLELPVPNHSVRERFKATYWPAYSTGYRATPGSIETLTRLRELGYRIAIVTDGKASVSRKKIHDIGAEDFVERLFTPADVNGHKKPNTEIFELAVREMGGTNDSTWVVGDAVTRDVRGAIDAGLSAIHYIPEVVDDIQGTFEANWYGQIVPTITHMNQLLEVLESDNTAGSE